MLDLNFKKISSNMQSLGVIRLNPKLKHRVGRSLSFKKNVKYDFVRPFTFFRYKVHI